MDASRAASFRTYACRITSSSFGVSDTDQHRWFIYLQYLTEVSDYFSALSEIP